MQKTREKFPSFREKEVQRHRDTKETEVLRDHKVHKRYRVIHCYDMENRKR